MNVIVTDAGFNRGDLMQYFTPLAQIAANNCTASLAIDLASDDDPAALAPYLAATHTIRVNFPSFADGRGFSIAKCLREMGYLGRLRAGGNLIADQYAMARRSGFDEVEISQSLALRQPEEQWVYRANWQRHDYRSHLQGFPLNETGSIGGVGHSPHRNHE